MPHPSHFSQFDPPNNIRWAVPIIQPLSMQYSPLPCYNIPLTPNIALSTFSQTPLAHFSPSRSVTISLTVQNKRQNYTAVRINLNMCGQQTGIQILCTEWQQAFKEFSLPLISYWIQFWFVKVVPKYLNSSTLSMELLSIFFKYTLLGLNGI